MASECHPCSRSHPIRRTLIRHPPTKRSIQKNHEVAERALDDHLKPDIPIMDTPPPPDTMFIVNPELDTETLLAHACESLASANVMTLDLADRTQGSSRNTLLGIAQVIMLGELAMNRALDRFDPRE